MDTTKQSHNDMILECQSRIEKLKEDINTFRKYIEEASKNICKLNFFIDHFEELLEQETHE